MNRSAQPGISSTVGGVVRGDLSALLARVEAATGPDREIDHALFMMERGDWLLRHGFLRNGGDSYWSDTPPVAGACRVAGPEHYTASLDASLALCERVLPGCLWTVKHLGEGDYAADVGSPDFEAVMLGSDVTRSPPLALLSAMLSALIASAASPESGPSQTLADPNILPLQGVDRDHSPSSTNLECDGGSAATEGLSQAEGET